MDPEKLFKLSSKTFSSSQSPILLDQIYGRCITNPDLLRNYKGFSYEVYGETGHQLVSGIIKTFNIRKNHKFIDLGSGIGNVVLQVAAETGCECHGVELKKAPAAYAKSQLDEFQARLQMYGRRKAKINFIHGDFLENSEVPKILENVDFVFINNYAFGAQLNQKLMQLFLGLKDGAKIVCFQTFRAVEHKISLHNMNDIASIMTVEKFGYPENSVSWTASAGNYYVHVIDRGPLKDFIETISSSRNNHKRRK